MLRRLTEINQALASSATAGGAAAIVAQWNIDAPLAWRTLTRSFPDFEAACAKGRRFQGFGMLVLLGIAGVATSEAATALANLGSGSPGAVVYAPLISVAAVLLAIVLSGLQRRQANVDVAETLLRRLLAEGMAPEAALATAAFVFEVRMTEAERRLANVDATGVDARGRAAIALVFMERAPDNRLINGAPRALVMAGATCTILAFWWFYFTMANGQIFETLP